MIRLYCYPEMRGFQIEQRFVKRILDIVFSVLGLILSSPFFCGDCIDDKMHGQERCFVRQDRLTQNGKVFSICKFRTMIQDAEKDTGARLASDHDDRILPVGEISKTNQAG